RQAGSEAMSRNARAALWICAIAGGALAGGALAQTADIPEDETPAAEMPAAETPTDEPRATEFSPEPAESSAQTTTATKEYDSGAVYQGAFKDGKQHGQGTYTTPD